VAADNFRAPFTAAEGWGTYAQTVGAGQLRAKLEIRWGRVRIRSLGLTPEGAAATVVVKLGAAAVPARLEATPQGVEVILGREVVLLRGQELEVVLA